MPNLTCKGFKLTFHDGYFDIVVTDQTDATYVLQSFSPDATPLIGTLLKRIADAASQSYVGWSFKSQNGVITG